MKNKLSAIQRVANDIKSIKIQWATNIAIAACAIMRDEILRHHFSSPWELKSFFNQWRKILEEARSTEPMLFNGMRYVQTIFKRFSTWALSRFSIVTMQKWLSDAFTEYLDLVSANDKNIIQYWSKVIKSRYNIVTHCHSWWVVKVLIEAHKQGKKIHVYNTETRPLYQGRKTSQDLIAAHIPNTMITDDAAPFFVDNNYESDVHIHMVIMGSDAIKLDGSIYNKIGSFSIALAARHSKVPVYIVGNLSKIDGEGKVQIEQRSGKELRPDAPKKLQILNHAFDMVPAKFITGIITEFGIIKPKDIAKTVKKHYPWMLT